MFYCYDCKTLSIEGILHGSDFYTQTVRYESHASDYDYMNDIDYYDGESDGIFCKFCNSQNLEVDVEVEEAFNLITDKHNGFIQLRKVKIDTTKIQNGDIAFTKKMLLLELI